MASKLEYLQRYMANSGGDAGDGLKKKKKVKKSKKSKSSALGTRVVDADDVWEHSAPSREAIDHKWELDGAEDERPLVVATDGEDLVDPQDLPVYVDSDKYLGELQAKQKQKEDEDLSPPRKRAAEHRGCNSDEASPPRRPRSDDTSPPRRRSDSKRTSRRRRESGDDDASPPRRKPGQQQSGGDQDSDDASPPRRSSNASRQERGRQEDASPPRRKEQRRRQSENNDASPPRRSATHDSSSHRERGRQKDSSPPRRRSSQTVSTQHTRGKDSDGDASPPRRGSNKEAQIVESGRKPGAAYGKEDSSPRRSRRDEMSRSDRTRHHSPSRSPTDLGRERRTDSLGRDIPPRSSRNQRRSLSESRGDNTPDRRRVRSRSKDRDQDRRRSQSPRSRRDRESHSPRRSTRWRSPQRNKSVRDRSRSRSRSQSRGKRRFSSLSRRVRSRSNSIDRHSSRHDRKKQVTDKSSGSRQEVKMPAQSDSPKKTKREPSVKAEASGGSKGEEEEKKAGLFTADEFEKQRKLAAKRKDMLRGADASDMGANAETVYRDKRGRKLDMLNEMVRQQEVLEGKRKREAREEYEWGTGAVQKRERQSQQELMDQMKEAPFARHEDDEELERMRRERVRAFDPINSKAFQEDPLAGEGKSKKNKKSKKDKKDKKEATKVKPKYAGPPAPPNRFGILPGYRWDGVVRGSNWEEKIMMKQNASTAVSEEAYKYAVADM